MKSNDAEFEPAVLAALKERDILGRVNFALLGPLDYYLRTEAEGFEQEFQKSRQRNPLLETTAPEAWIAAKIVPKIREVRSNVDVTDEVLSDAVQKYLLYRSATAMTSEVDDEQKLHTTIEQFIPAIEELLRETLDRRKSLADILALEINHFKVNQPLQLRVPKSLREQITVQAIMEKWPNPKLANELDRAKLKPKSKQFDSYKTLLHLDAQQFYSRKNAVKKKYQIGISRPSPDNSSRKPQC